MCKSNFVNIKLNSPVFANLSPQEYRRKLALKIKKALAEEDSSDI